jgi:hypothetical protein
LAPQATTSWPAPTSSLSAAGDGRAGRVGLPLGMESDTLKPDVGPLAGSRVADRPGGRAGTIAFLAERSRRSAPAHERLPSKAIIRRRRPVPSGPRERRSGGFRGAACNYRAESNFSKRPAALAFGCEAGVPDAKRRAPAPGRKRSSAALQIRPGPGDRFVAEALVCRPLAREGKRHDRRAAWRTTIAFRRKRSCHGPTGRC